MLLRPWVYVAFARCICCRWAHWACSARAHAHAYSSCPICSCPGLREHAGPRPPCRLRGMLHVCTGATAVRRKYLDLLAVTG